MKGNRLQVFTGIISLLLFFTACQLEVPIRDMVKARSKISRARDVKANRYAPKELSDAEKFLYVTHDNLKTEDDKKAKESAKKALSSAQKAIDISLPLLAADSIKGARTSLNEAQSVGASHFAPQEYSTSVTLLASAVSMQNETKYWDAHLTALKAADSAENARALSQRQMGNIPKMLEELQKELDDLMTDSFSVAAEKDLADAEKLIADCKLSYSRQEYKVIAEKSEEARKKLENARLIISKTAAKDKLKNVSGHYATVAAIDKDKKFEDDLSRVNEEIDLSKKQIEEGEYAAALSKAIGAEKLLVSVSDKIQAHYGKTSAIAGVSINGKDRVYVVKWRKNNTDCLWRIAAIVYSDAKLWPLIYMANKDQIKDPDIIFPGQRFIIPDPEEKKVVEEETEKSEDSEEKITAEDDKETINKEATDKEAADKETEEEDAASVDDAKSDTRDTE